MKGDAIMVHFYEGWSHEMHKSAKFKVGAIITTHGLVLALVGPYQHTPTTNIIDWMEHIYSF